MEWYHTAIIYHDTSEWPDSLSVQEVLWRSMPMAEAGDLRFLALAAACKLRISNSEEERRQAEEWIQNVLNSRRPDALCFLGEGYGSGQFGTKRLDLEKACFKRAAQIDPFKGLYMLGHHYLKLRETRSCKRYRAALLCFRKAASEGHIVSLYTYAMWKFNNPLKRVGSIFLNYFPVYKAAKRRMPRDVWWRYRDLAEALPKVVARLDRKFGVINRK